jgi:iron complex transport system ATP-binding protein
MIELRNLSLGYDRRTLVDNVNATFSRGRLCALLGRNGSGKSTLLRAIAGLGKPSSGQIVIDGNPLPLSPYRLSRTVAFVNTSRIRIANLRCCDVVALGRAPYTNWYGRMQPSDSQIVADALQMVGMADYALRTLDKMSDGECQRIMIARALAQDTPVVLLDEPTSFLDLPNRYEICRLLQTLAHDRDNCVLFSTHELDIALKMADDIALIHNPQLTSMTATSMAASGLISDTFSIPQ